MGHRPSSGQPYSDPGNPEDLYFSVSGDAPEKVQHMSGASSDGAEPDQGDAALSELGAGIKKRTKSTSGSAGQRTPITFEKDELVNIANRT